ncbi:MFS quinate transporter [Aspergillus arachidicola]|uniref:MFS quinate transporter n=1 Tax=Aspergillus arachidicola TaxID=656916 RepID=A0A2G7FHP7_9EURO|nr:MFS quinate transporter [Aspergillus arachidicola]
MGKNLGLVRAYYTVALACTGSFLFAYDTGIIGGVLTLKSFQNSFRYTEKQKSTINSNSNSLLQAGGECTQTSIMSTSTDDHKAFFACFFVWPFTAKFGRRWSIALASLIFCIGAIIQVIPTHSVAAFYVARVISGIGVGMATVIIPMYTSEMAPKSIRGRLGSFFQGFFVLGVFFSYWIDYAVEKHIPETSDSQWQIPIGLQLVPGGILGLGMLFVKESVRWLAKKGRHDEAMKSLVWIRGGEETEEVRAEMAEILDGIEAENLATEGVTWKEILRVPGNLHRMCIAVTIQIGVQITGNTSLAYYAPQIFQAVGAGDNSLFISGFFGVAKVISCWFFLLFLVERIGRRWSLIIGAFLMGSLMLIVGILAKLFPPDPDATSISSAGIASILMVYFEAMCYNMSWGPVPWLYMSEIFPTRIREVGIAVGTATQWLFNFVFSQATPHALDSMGWGMFLMFCIFNWILVVYAWLFIKETTGKSLEEMEEVFNSRVGLYHKERPLDEQVQNKQ